MLGRLGGSDVVDVLWRAIAGADARDRWSLFQTLAQVPEGGPRLLDALRDPDPDIRAPAYACLVSAEQGALAGDRVALTVAVVRGLSDPDRDVQETAVRLAGRLRISIAEPKLLALAQQADVAGALRALGELRSESALPIALAAAQTGGHRQREAIEALVLHGRRADSERALLCAFAAADDIDLRADIVKALAEVGSAESLPVLETFLRREARRLTKRTRKDVKHTLLPAIQRLRKPPGT